MSGAKGHHARCNTRYIYFTMWCESYVCDVTFSIWCSNFYMWWNGLYLGCTMFQVWCRRLHFWQRKLYSMQCSGSKWEHKSNVGHNTWQCSAKGSCICVEDKKPTHFVLWRVWKKDFEQRPDRFRVFEIVVICQQNISMIRICYKHFKQLSCACCMSVHTIRFVRDTNEPDM